MNYNGYLEPYLQQIIELHLDGLTNAQVAGELLAMGVTAPRARCRESRKALSGVVGHALRSEGYGRNGRATVGPRPWDGVVPTDVARSQRMWERTMAARRARNLGLSLQEIAKWLKISPTLAWHAMHRPVNVLSPVEVYLGTTPTIGIELYATLRYACAPATKRTRKERD